MSGHKDHEGRISKYDIARPDPTLCRQKRIRCCGRRWFWDTVFRGKSHNGSGYLTQKRVWNIHPQTSPSRGEEPIHFLGNVDDDQSEASKHAEVAPDRAK